MQGLGGGGCLSVTEIIYSDLVPLPERGKFMGIIASYVFVVSSLISEAYIGTIRVWALAWWVDFIYRQLHIA